MTAEEIPARLDELKARMEEIWDELGTLRKASFMPLYPKEEIYNAFCSVAGPMDYDLFCKAWAEASKHAPTCPRD